MLTPLLLLSLLLTSRICRRCCCPYRPPGCRVSLGCRRAAQQEDEATPEQLLLRENLRLREDVQKLRERMAGLQADMVMQTGIVNALTRGGRRGSLPPSLCLCLFVWWSPMFVCLPLCVCMCLYVYVRVYVRARICTFMSACFYVCVCQCLSVSSPSV